MKNLVLLLSFFVFDLKADSFKIQGTFLNDQHGDFNIIELDGKGTITYLDLKPLKGHKKKMDLFTALKDKKVILVGQKFVMVLETKGKLFKRKFVSSHCEDPSFYPLPGMRDVSIKFEDGNVIEEELLDDEDIYQTVYKPLNELQIIAIKTIGHK